MQRISGIVSLGVVVIVALVVQSSFATYCVLNNECVRPCQTNPSVYFAFNPSCEDNQCWCIPKPVAVPVAAPAAYGYSAASGSSNQQQQKPASRVKA